MTELNGFYAIIQAKVSNHFQGGEGEFLMQVISFMNMKGGVGKTTLAVNIAYGLAYLHRKSVLLIDADPQFNATQALVKDDAYLAHLEDDTKGTLKDIFMPVRPGRIKTTSGGSKQIDKRGISLDDCTFRIFRGVHDRGRLDLIPSTLDLIDIETSQRGAEKRLDAFLRKKATGYDYVIIDCPPTISIFTMAAILASRKYLVPLKPDPLSVIGLPLLERWLSDYTEDQGLTVGSVGLVFTMVRGSLPKRMRGIMQEVRQARGDEVFDEQLNVATAVSESVEHRQPVFLYHKSRNAKIGRQMKAIIEEFLERTSGDEK